MHWLVRTRRRTKVALVFGMSNERTSSSGARGRGTVDGNASLGLLVERRGRRERGPVRIRGVVVDQVLAVQDLAGLRVHEAERRDRSDRAIGVDQHLVGQ